MRESQKPRKDRLNEFWKRCADKGIQIEVGRTESKNIDEEIWSSVEHDTTQGKNTRRGHPHGFEPLTRTVQRSFLYRAKNKKGKRTGEYTQTVLREEFKVFKREAT